MNEETKICQEVPEGLSKESWNEDHLNFKHQGVFYTWCPLCMAKQDGEKNDVKNNDLSVEVADSIPIRSIFGK